MKRGLMIIIAVMFLFLVNTAVSEVHWYEDWERGWHGWYASNGVWQVGMPDAPGPEQPHSDTMCAGTIIDGQYPANADTRLISPIIEIPGAGDNPRLKLYHWYRIRENDYDYGYIQLLIDQQWVTIFQPLVNESPAWTHLEIDLTPYAGIATRLGFYFVSDPNHQDMGWYIDDICLVTGECRMLELNVAESFEGDVEEWCAIPGIWEIGVPGSPGPTQAFDSLNCAGTILNARYPNNCNARLISPPFELSSSADNCELRFWHWYKFTSNDDDYGLLQAKVEHTDSIWETVGGPFDDQSQVWTQYIYSLNDYIGYTIRICFLLITDNGSVQAGWYIDSLIVGVDMVGIDEKQSTPSNISLFQNCPNPFNTSTLIKYELPEQSLVTIDIYDILGRQVYTLEDGLKQAGHHRIIWDADGLSSGVYFYKLTADDFEQTCSMTLIK